MVLDPLRFAVFGTSFWSNYQIPAWFDVGGVDLVAAYNRTRARAEAVAQKFGIPKVYDDPEELLRNESIDFMDIIADVGVHAHLVNLAVKYRKPVICQKPMAPDLATAEKMVADCRAAGISFYIHENWRWQTPIRELSRVLASGVVGRPFRARIDMISGFPVFANQPVLRTLEQFILTDLGSHILDVARYLFGEAESLYCQTKKVHGDISGEDVATVMMEMSGNTTVTCNLAYAENFLEREAFPQTFIFIEGERGSLELRENYWLRVTTREGTLIRHVPPPRYSWADPAYEVVHASIRPCNENLLYALQGKGTAETSGDDNIKTVRLVFAAYDSAASGNVIRF